MYYSLKHNVLLRITKIMLYIPEEQAGVEHQDVRQPRRVLTNTAREFFTSTGTLSTERKDKRRANTPGAILTRQSQFTSATH